MPLTMYTTTWCGFCRRLKGQLARAGVEVTEVDIEKDEASAKFVMSVNGGNQTVPTLLFADGSTMVNPSAAQVQARLAELAAAPDPGVQSVLLRISAKRPGLLYTPGVLRARRGFPMDVVTGGNLAVPRESRQAWTG